MKQLDLWLCTNQRLPKTEENKIEQRKIKTCGKCFWLVCLLVGSGRAESEHNTKSQLPSAHEQLFSVISLKFHIAHDWGCYPKDSEITLLTSWRKTDGPTETSGYIVVCEMQLVIQVAILLCKCTSHHTLLMSVRLCFEPDQESFLTKRTSPKQPDFR